MSRARHASWRSSLSHTRTHIVRFAIDLAWAHPGQTKRICSTTSAWCSVSHVMTAEKKECDGGSEEFLGHSNTADQCRELCVTKQDVGCVYFLWGIGTNNRCWWEGKCQGDGGTMINNDNYNIYKVTWDLTPGTLRGFPSLFPNPLGHLSTSAACFVQAGAGATRPPACYCVFLY